jgi:tetratricopeptide (TPR) repeat protein
MTNFENITFYDEEALLDRLSDGIKESSKEVVFVVGAPLTAPEEIGQPGVSNVADMISDIRGRFPSGSGSLITLESNIASAPNQYQAAFHFLQGRRGQDACNKVVRNAVLRSRITTVGQDATYVDLDDLNDENLSEFETDLSGWHLSRGVEALGKLVALKPNLFGRTLLTSNFDPLAEVSIKRAGGQSWQTSLIQDADLGNSKADGCHVIHFHGFWRGTDTLHTGAQLLQSRPALKSSLLEILKDKLVVVMAYGGWEDILTAALKDLTGNGAKFPEILWTFYDSTPAIPKHLRSVLQPGLNRGRTSLYAGIDCHSFLPKLFECWSDDKPSASVNPANNREITQFSVTPTTLKQLDCDRPPHIETWVGRDAELRSLETTQSPVVILSGIGGQGKSLTAAKHINETFETTAEFKCWDWRDCKEAADSIRTQVIAAVDRITSEETTSDMLVESSDADLADLLVACSLEARTIFVFDNVDHYVDLEKFRFVGLLDKLVTTFAATPTTSKLILTCRPQVRYSEASIITIPMPGLNLSEAEALFKKRGVNSSNVTFSDIEAAHEMTEGHPFWLDLMAVQVAQVPGTTLNGLLEDLRRGREESPNVLSSIWTRLSKNEQLLLRIMAEAVRPETKDTLEKYVSTKLRYNKFDKALKSLIRLNLVVTKPEVNAPDLYDLHPLVRRFVKQSFSPSEREDFIKLVIGQYNTFVSTLEKMLGFSLPLPLLGRWTQKAELEIKARLFQDAANTLTDARSALIGGGHSEEFIRVARMLVERLDWSTASTDIKGFDTIVSELVECMDQLGDFESADSILEKFEATIPEKTARYILYCDMRAYSSWQRGDFEKAVEWGEAGLDLKAQTNVDTQYGNEYNLALAKRDAGDIKSALKFFLGGEDIETVANAETDSEEYNGPKFGNIGRCLQLSGDVEQALLFYKKSICELEKDASSNRLSNAAYARQWISECLEVNGENALALAFAVSAEDLLAGISPSRAKFVAKLSARIRSKLEPEQSQIDVTSANRKVKHWIKNVT